MSAHIWWEGVVGDTQESQLSWRYLLAEHLLPDLPVLYDLSSFHNSKRSCLPTPFVKLGVVKGQASNLCGQLLVSATQAGLYPQSKSCFLLCVVAFRKRQRERGYKLPRVSYGETPGCALYAS